MSLPFLGPDITWRPAPSEIDVAVALLGEPIRCLRVLHREPAAATRDVVRSLTSFIEATEEIVPRRERDQAAPSGSKRRSLADVANAVVDEVVLPFIVRWLPMLDDDSTNLVFRSELGAVRDQLGQYVFVLGRATGTYDGADLASPGPQPPSPSIGAVSAGVEPSVPGGRTLSGRPRAHMTRWFDPFEVLYLSMRKAVKDDRAETAPADPVQPARSYEVPDGTDFWFDFVADLGDAFDPTMDVAWLAGREQLELVPDDGSSPMMLSRGAFLVLGGDEVYPYASEAHYRNQLVGPFEQAFEGTERADVWAIPGNHDWYGGLDHWRKVFCAGTSLGRWDAPQQTSWFSLRLPRGWWLWGVDTQLDGSIDAAQVEYFHDAAMQLEPDERVILCTPVPMWRLRESHVAEFAALEAFVERTIEPTGAHATVYLSGDLHAFASFRRRRAAGVDEHHITSGGGGAFTHPTHNLGTVVPQTEIGVPAEDAIDPAPFVAGEFWPPATSSFRLVGSQFWRGVWDRQSRFLVGLLGLMHLGYGLVAGRGVRVDDLGRGGRGLVDVIARLVTRMPGALVTPLAVVTLAAAGVMMAKPDTQERLVLQIRRRVGLAHGLLQALWLVVVAGSVHWAIWQYSDDRWRTHASWAAALVGALVGGLGAVVLLAADLVWVNRRYPVNGNEAFAARHSFDFKHFLRCRIDPHGNLHVYLIAIEQIRTGWARAITSGSPLPPGAPSDPPGDRTSVPVARVEWSTTIEGPLHPTSVPSEDDHDRQPGETGETGETGERSYTAPMLTERLTLHGDLLDQHHLLKVLDELERLGVVTKVRRFRVGERAQDPSIAELTIQADTRRALVAACRRAGELGATYDDTQAELAEADLDGVLPEGFHSTTNFPTYVLIDGTAIPVERIEMDCGIRVWQAEGQWRAETCPMHKAKQGDQFVVGYLGVRIELTAEHDTDDIGFQFMSSEVSSERPKRRLIADAADAIREVRAAGLDVVFVGGPAIVHSGSAPLLARLIEAKWVTVLLAGNALAAHDIEADMLGTSLGVDLESGHSGPHGHTHHLRAINRVRRAGSIRAAVEQGLITGGIMHTCITNGTPFVLCGSIRDDGPLPDVITNTLEATDAMRAVIENAGACLMVATMLHSVAVGNIMHADVRTFCVDTDADTVIKLTDRGTHQAVGIVTDCEYFLSELCRQLGA